ncbi:MAG TPA: FAD synthetase family protein [Bacteroidales bacterium]|jgi:riboflavin kinase/FMN adenylyltransferase|nr:FAD synthetase family protein [Bacteroidales bacterium]HNX84797.1 FAD synthetase family protein [Bacteroidales bacterium]HOC47880.1 FAD synthetase family protein [Bacteroidales bacterium]HPS97186.1 FAD synthetase family protein [Bacteroidales bacterium]
MRIFRSFQEASVINAPVVTTGTFDGVHIGHRTIIKRLKKLASDYGGESVLITFHPHPRVVLYPETAGKGLKLICSQEEKIELLRKAGLDNVIIIEFTRDFSKVTSEEFVRDILCGVLGAKVIVVGHNHHFGFNQEGDYRTLWEWREKYGFEAEEIPMQEVQNETVSSTRIRQALKEGYIQRANAYLDHFYLVIGTAVKDDPGLAPLVPMVRIPVTDVTKLVPAPGLYAVSCAAETYFSRGMVCIPESTGLLPDLFLHLENYESDIPGKRMTLFFHKRLDASRLASDPAKALVAGAEEMKELIF